MKNGWVALQKNTWDDDAFQELSSDARLLFLWSWSNRWANTAGLYRVALHEMTAALHGDDTERVRAALREMTRKPLVIYDLPSEMLWVVNRARHVAVSPRATSAVLSAYHRQPDGQLKRLWHDRYARQFGLANGSVRQVA